MSPRRDRLRRRVVDQAVGPDRRGQHARALVGKQVEPACGVAAHAQELAPLVGPRPVEVGAHRRRPRRQRRSRPAARSSTGRTASRKVTKLDTGLPGRPMNSAVAAVGAAHRAEGQRLAGLDRDLPQVEPAFGLHRRACRWSSSPTETPPEVRIRSLPARAAPQRVARGVELVGHDAEVGARRSPAPAAGRAA